MNISRNFRCNNWSEIWFIPCRDRLSILWVKIHSQMWKNWIFSDRPMCMQYFGRDVNHVTRSQINCFSFRYLEFWNSTTRFFIINQTSLTLSHDKHLSASMEMNFGSSWFFEYYVIHIMLTWFRNSRYFTKHYWTSKVVFFYFFNGCRGNIAFFQYLG